MEIGQVIGTVVSTRKHERLVGSKIQIVQPLEPNNMTAEGDPYVAIDVVGAGVGEQVLIARGSAARKAMDNDAAPVDAAIVGIIDEVDISSTKADRH